MKKGLTLIIFLALFVNFSHASQKTLNDHDITGNLDVDLNANIDGLLIVDGNIEGGSGFKLNTTTTAINYVALTSDHVIFCSASGITVTLFTANGNNGRLLYVKNNSASGITVDAHGAETIDGDANMELIQDETIRIVSDGTGWFII
jgi:hypothetical protein